MLNILRNGGDSLHLLVKLANAGQVEEKLAARAKLQHEVQLALGLESVGQLDDEWVRYVFL